jgi:hypothetical protein
MKFFVHYLPFTFFNFGFLALAAGLAFRVAEAKIAPADSADTLSFAAILAFTALKPGCFPAMILLKLRGLTSFSFSPA